MNKSNEKNEKTESTKAEKIFALNYVCLLMLSRDIKNHGISYAIDELESHISYCNMVIRDWKEKLKLEHDKQKHQQQ